MVHQALVVQAAYKVFPAAVAVATGALRNGGCMDPGGGGGSSFAMNPATTTLVTNTQGYNVGDGQITISYSNGGTYTIAWDGLCCRCRLCSRLTMRHYQILLSTIAIPAGVPQRYQRYYLHRYDHYQQWCGMYVLAQPISITINTTPSIDPASIAGQSACTGATTATENPTGPVAGTNFTWTNDNTAIGLPSGGTGSIIGFTAANNTPGTLIKLTLHLYRYYRCRLRWCTGNHYRYRISYSLLSAIHQLYLIPSL